MGKQGNFGLSKALTQANFANIYVGVCHCQGPISAYTHLFFKDSIHVTLADSRKGVRLQIGYLLIGVSHLRTLLSNTHSTKSRRTPNSVRSLSRLFLSFSLFIHRIVIAAYHRSLEDTPQARTSVIKSMWNLNVSLPNFLRIVFTNSAPVCHAPMRRSTAPT
jgi:hypothetical protein